MKLHLMLCTCVLYALPQAGAQETDSQEFLGAAAIINKIQAAQDKKKVEPDESDSNSLSQQIERYTQILPELSSEAAATQWLQLVDSLATIQPDYNQPNQTLGLAKLIQVIPGPESWSALHDAIETRPIPADSAAVREHILRMIAHLLVEDTDSQLADLQALEKAIADSQVTDVEYYFRELATSLMHSSIDPDLATDLLTSQIEAQIEAGNTSHHETLTIPDLVTLVGAENAESILRKALLTSLELEIETGDLTKQLARKLAMELIEQLPIAQWGLCHSIDSLELFEALQKRFLKTSKNDKEPPSLKKRLGKYSLALDELWL